MNGSQNTKRKKVFIIIMILVGVLMVTVGIFTVVLALRALSYTGGSMKVGSRIKNEDIKEFYCTYSPSSFPPEYRRYRIYKEDGNLLIYYETREGNRFPLTEEDITLSGTAVLSEEEKAVFFDSLSGGSVKKRTEHTDSGDPGPWFYLYWNGDRDKYQEFEFESVEKSEQFEKLCISLAE